MKHQDQIDQSNTQYPLLIDRVQSTFIDTLFLIVMMFVASNVLDQFEHVPDWVRIAIVIVLFVVYEPLSTSLGATLGNFIKGIRVRKVSDNTKNINLFQALYRYIIKLMLGWISFLTIHSNKERRAIHDMAAGTVMIKKRAQN